MSKEKVTLYVPKTLEKAKELFKKFENMGIERLDEAKFFFLFEKGEGNVGFCIRDNTWQVCPPDCDLFDITLVEM